MRCRRKWDLSFRRNLELPRYNSALSTGSAVHHSLQAHYKGSDALAALSHYWSPILTEMDADDPQRGQLDKDVELSGIMIDGYLDWIADEAADAYLTPVAVEETVNLLIRPDVTLHGTLDLVQADPDGNIWLMDHKTTDAFGRLADRRLQLNFQLLTYAVLCEEFFGKAPAGAYLNMLRKVKRTASAKPPFYQREPVHFNQHQLAAHREHMLAILQDMESTEARIAGGNLAAAYPTVDADCSWKCPYLPVCPMFDDGSDYEGALNDLYVKRS